MGEALTIEIKYKGKTRNGLCANIVGEHLPDWKENASWCFRKMIDELEKDIKQSPKPIQDHSK